MFFKKLIVGHMIGTNCYIIASDDSQECIVIDPGADAERIRVAAGFRRIAGVLLTHGHFDHIGAVSELMTSETHLYLHPFDVPLLADASKNGSRILTGMDVTVDETAESIDEGDELKLAGLNINVMHTPGHTRGSVCFRICDALFSGDTMFENGWGRTDLYGGNEGDIMRSLRRLLPMREICELYPGHDA